MINDEEFDEDEIKKDVPLVMPNGVIIRDMLKAMAKMLSKKERNHAGTRIARRVKLKELQYAWRDASNSSRNKLIYENRDYKAW